MSAAQTMATLAESARETERIERERLEREPSFVTAMSSSPVDSPPTDTEEDSCLPSSLAVEGRVFRRLQRFQLLASELKAQSDMVTTYLLTPKVRLHVFEQRKHWWQHPLHLAKAGQGTFILGRQLLKAILKYLLLSHAANNSLRDAQQLAEALILSGFLSPAHEAPNVDDEPIEELYIFDDSYYELVAPGATAVPSLESEHSLSVWALTDGATRAGRCYAVVNKTKHHSLVLFETDVARRDLVRILVLQSKPEQEQWLVALIDAGAAFLETHAAILSFAASTASLYSLRDTDASGNTFCLSELRGHVALLTNVSSGTCSSNAKQLQQLEELSSKYVDAGLTVVAFPSAQFGDGEFGNDEDLVEYFHELFGVNFPVLATRDVNGPSARDAMLFCKTRLPGAAKSAANAFIENNYVKFLVGRDGHLFKRYGACDLPLSMETDIQNLLQATPPESRP
ncbi:glutathione peroxidase, putative [Phytophthora infestans T30-4]|uniref:Glutathione peroxidase, putative n=1 Tax=Phytophthora infestans (strain T30-4) TaxID=403677 RepID=D0NXV4_PHYIT|nr:glutathione peroxidase, putative [Phytophthora infestans T30-4]EEY67905.1 glutathione peroxidase, putative [Phytophthora infestans T30-4]|eukprot:XP_002997767.1 glutathione peroxidase, putative [Phytophthora infestans T30-4]